MVVILGKVEGPVFCCALEKPGEMADPVEVYRVCPFLSLSLSRYDIPSQEDLRVSRVHVFFLSHVVNEIGEWGVGFLFLSQKPSKSLVLSLSPPNPSHVSPLHGPNKQRQPSFFLSQPPSPPSPKSNSYVL